MCLKVDSMLIERYKADVKRLIDTGRLLRMSMILENNPDAGKAAKLSPEKIAKLPKFTEKYQAWYSESLSVIQQLLPARADDFRSYYSPIKTRKDITYENYTISDYLKGLTITRGPLKEKIVGPDAAMAPMLQFQPLTSKITSLLPSKTDSKALSLIFGLWCRPTYLKMNLMQQKNSIRKVFTAAPALWLA